MQQRFTITQRSALIAALCLEQRHLTCQERFQRFNRKQKPDEIKEDWIYEVRRGIVGGVQKTFGVDGEGNDTFKEKQLKDTSNNNLKNNDADFEVIDAEFEVIEEVDYEVVEEDGTLKKKPKGNTMNDLPKDVQEALRKRAWIG